MHDATNAGSSAPLQSDQVSGRDIPEASGRLKPITLTVAVPVPLRRDFDYCLPTEVDAGCHDEGSRVLVPFGSRTLVGVITGSRAAQESDAANLKPVEQLLDPESPTLPAPILKLCKWAARYYQAPLGEVLAAAIPPALRQTNGPGGSQQIRAWSLTDAGRGTDPESLKRAPRQQQALQCLRARQPIPTGSFEQDGISAAVLRTMRDRGLIEATSIDRQEPAADPLPRGPRPTLHPEQAEAVEAISAGLGKFQSFLLDGVTGSGKTEVYLRVIERVLDAGQQALVLIPEISLTPQTLQRFSARFGTGRVAALHSGLSANERLQAWRAASEGRAEVVIATRSGIFTPLPRPGIVIVDEEHDTSFKQQEGFRYSARDLGLIRARDEQIPILLGSATPSLETLRNTVSGKYQHLHLKTRAGGASMPGFTVEDLRGQKLRGGLSTALIIRMRKHLAAGQQVLVFLNRRGYAPVLMCNDCGWVAECRACDSRMTMHMSSRQLRCHHCQHTRPIPNQCLSCQSTELVPLGTGTQRSEETLEELFPDTTVIRIDRDTTQRKSAYAELSERMQSGEPCILVGTQMLAKGHDFPGVTLVAILDADSGLMSSDFRGVERTGQLIWQVAGRAGRADRPGEVFLQTCQPQHPALRQLLAEGYPAFAATLLNERREAALPPYTSLCLIRADAPHAGPAMQFLHEVRDAIPAGAGDLECWGPAPSPMQKRAGRFRAQLVLCSARRAALQEVLPKVGSLMEQSKLGRKLRWSMDVDPVDLF